jgi:hypothetical protein
MPALLRTVLAVAFVNWAITVGRLIWRRVATPEAMRQA